MCKQLINILIIVVLVTIILTELHGHKMKNKETIMLYDSGLIFFDLETNKTLLPPIVTSENYMAGINLRLPLIGKPCTCQESKCGCCVGMNLKQFNRKLCSNFTYDARSSIIDMQVLLNDRSIYKNQISSRAWNPSPFCFPIPVPYIPIRMDMCMKLFDIEMQGGNVNMCMDMTARIESAPVIVLHFDCMRMGVGGVGFFKPGQGSGGGGGEVVTNSGTYNPTQSQSGSTPAGEEPQVDYDIYDEVTEIKRPVKFG